MSPWVIAIIVLVVLVILVKIVTRVLKSRREGKSPLALGGDEPGDEIDAEGGGPFRLSIRDPWYTKMLNGEKLVEGRLDKKPFNTIKEGDPIVVIRSRPKGDTSEYPGGKYKYTSTVKRITTYENFAALLKKEKAAKVYPGKTAAEATEIFNEFLPASASADSSVLAIEVEAP